MPGGDLKLDEKGRKTMRLVRHLTVAELDVAAVPLDLEGDTVLKARCRLEELDWDRPRC